MAGPASLREVSHGEVPSHHPASPRHLTAPTSSLAGMDKSTETTTRASPTFGADALKLNPSRDARYSV